MHSLYHVGGSIITIGGGIITIGGGGGLVFFNKDAPK